MNYKNFDLLRISFYSFVLAFSIFLIAYLAIDFAIEMWWFNTLNYMEYFVFRQCYMDLIGLLVTLLLTGIFYINFRLAIKFIAADGIIAGLQDDHTLLTGILKRASLKWFLPLSILLSIPILIPVYGNWETLLLYFFSTNSGVVDPAYGKDISYYLFSYPVYQLIQNELMIVFSLLVLLLAGFYWAAYKKLQQRQHGFPTIAKIHLTVLILLVILLQAWPIVLERIELLYESRHTPAFFGPGAVEMNYQLPLIWLTFFAFLGAALSLIFYIHKQQGVKVIIAFSLVYLLLLGAREITFIPEIIDEYYVKPNPLQAESRYMKYNIDATLHAFGLDKVKKIAYSANSTLTPEISTEISKQLYNIPIWDSHLLANVYEQLQGIQPYFDFSNIATDIYTLDGKDHQVNIAVRELALQKLPPEAKSWKNRHLVYTHGYGVVISPSAQQANKPLQWMVQDLALNTKYQKLTISQPEIYYGMGHYDYAIVPNSAPNAFVKDLDTRPEYVGKGGLRVSSFIRKLVLALFLREEKIFFSTSVIPESRLLLRRNIRERIQTVAPFLQLDPNPVPVIVNHKIYWIVDAYTTSNQYPLVESVPMSFENQADSGASVTNINYIRNSVKIIVDAYNGTVDFYIVDHSDPLITAYSRAYPSLFKDVSRIPREFIKHLSYPEALFKQQMEVYARYHQTNPTVFYQQSERLQIAKINNQALPPFYLTIDPQEDINQPPSERQKFLLVSILSPFQRDNLAMIAVAGCLNNDDCDINYSEQIFAYQFPKDLQIEGPAQISSLINQTPEISQQFTLWGQRGSKVIRGRIIVMPVEDLILYIQPIYLAATRKTGFPQLSRVIVAMNHQAVMDTSLELAYKKLEQKLQQK